MLRRLLEPHGLLAWRYDRDPRRTALPQV